MWIIKDLYTGCIHTSQSKYSAGGYMLKWYSLGHKISCKFVRYEEYFYKWI